MKKTVWLSLLLLSLILACGKDKKAPAKAPEPAGEKADDGMKPADGDGAPDKAAAGDPISCETLFARHGRCIFPVPETSVIYNIPVGDSPKKGAAEPLVTVVEFSEFQCPACKGFGLKVIPELLKKYEGKIQIVFKHFPLNFHEYAQLAAIVAEEVRAQKGEDAFWKFHDKVFEDQDKLGLDFLNETAKGLGVDLDKLAKVVADEKNKHKERIDAEYQLGEKVDVEGTPWVYVNGVLFNPEDHDLFKLIEDQIAKAEAAVAAGTPRAKVYGFLVNHGDQLKNETPVPKEEQERQLKNRETFFLDKCKAKDPQVMMFVGLLSACSKPDVPCDVFMQCVEKQVRQQLPEAE
jgi:protein-disulfide isomerase